MFDESQDLSLPLLPVMIISCVWARFNSRLLIYDHSSMFCSSAALDWILLAGIIRCVSFAHLRIRLLTNTAKLETALDEDVSPWPWRSGLLNTSGLVDISGLRP